MILCTVHFSAQVPRLIDLNSKTGLVVCDSFSFAAIEREWADRKFNYDEFNE